MISVLAKREGPVGERSRRAPLALFALRPGAGYGKVEKIRTLGVRAAFVGSFEVKDAVVGAGDMIAEGREAWDAVFATVTLGKFFLGFGAIGICEHAYAEAIEHLSGRVLYGRPAIEMGHLRRAMREAYLRLLAMKLYAYRTLDYVSAACEEDRRYLLFTAVQKARVSTQGVRVMGLLSECVGAFGFESRTFFEMALRDIQLIPGLEGSVHVSLAMTAEFAERYFGIGGWERGMPAVEPVSAGGGKENAYLMEARAGGFHRVAFGDFQPAYRAWAGVRAVQVFARQVRALRVLLRDKGRRKEMLTDGELSLEIGGLLAMVCYGQLVAENARLLGVSAEAVGEIFELLVADLSAEALRLAGRMEGLPRRILMRMVRVG
jgi:acyl-CoA dehydrogenase